MAQEGYSKGRCPDKRQVVIGVLRTNTELTFAEVAQSYKSLWQVERAFRELKTGLNLRTVYHHTDTRVQGHIMICFLSLILETALCRNPEEAGSSFPSLGLVDDFNELRAVEVSLDNQRFLSRTEMVGQAYEAFKALGLRTPNLVQVMPPFLKTLCSGMSVNAP